MTNPDLLKQIKLLTITALVSDEILVGLLVLKGGNALDIGYDLSDRGSIDIDFSMEKDFTEDERNRVKNQSEGLLNKEFNQAGLYVFDTKLLERPKHIKEEVQDFWGGYCLQFKSIELDKAKQFEYDIEKIRRNAIAIAGDNSTVFEVDISKYEYVGKKRAKDLDGATVYIYSPEMLALEKVRALCQQNSAYRKVVLSMTPKSRARDFFDIHNLCQSFNLDFTDPENIEIAQHIFNAKKVPMHYIAELDDQKEFHRQSWDSVVATIGTEHEVKEFDYYFDFVKRTFLHLVKSL